MPVVTTKLVGNLPFLPVYNVKDYGAYGDGVHDDSAAGNACISAAAAVNGTAYFPAGTYYLGSGPLVPQAGVWIMGAGKTATVFTTSGSLTGSNACLIRGANSTPPYPDHVTISDLGVDAANGTQSDAVQLEGFDYLEVARVRISNSYGRGLTIGTVGGSPSGPTFIASPYIHDVEIVNSRNDDAIGGGGISDLTIENVWVINPGTDGGDITNVTRGRISNYHVVQGNSGSTGAGLSSDFGWQDVDVSGLYVYGMGYVGLFQSSTSSAAQATKNLRFAGVHGSNIQLAFFRLAGASGADIASVDISDLYATDWNVGNTGPDGVIAQYVSGFRWRGGAVGSPANGAYGIGIDTGCSDVLLDGVDLSVIGGSAFRPLTTPGVAVRNCPGYNPVGSSVPGTAFALPASGTAWTNNTGVDGTLFVTGAGAVTDVVVQGVTVASSLSVGQSYFVPAGGTITFTYTTAPTLVFVGN